jgi:hypothetical protein
MPRVVVSLETPLHSIVVLSLKPDTLRDYRRSLTLYAAYLRSVSPHVLRSVEGVGMFAAFPSVGVLDASFAAFLEYAVSSRISLSAARTAFSALRTFNPVLDRSLPVSHDCVTRLERLSVSVAAAADVAVGCVSTLGAWRRWTTAVGGVVGGVRRLPSCFGASGSACDVVVPAPGGDRRLTLLLPRPRPARAACRPWW